MPDVAQAPRSARANVLRARTPSNEAARRASALINPSALVEAAGSTVLPITHTDLAAVKTALRAVVGTACRVRAIRLDLSLPRVSKTAAINLPASRLEMRGAYAVLADPKGHDLLYIHGTRNAQGFPALRLRCDPAALLPFSGYMGVTTLIEASTLLPFVMLRAVVRSRSPQFEWSVTTQQALATYAMRLAEPLAPGVAAAIFNGDRTPAIGTLMRALSRMAVPYVVWHHPNSPLDI